MLKLTEFSACIGLISIHIGSRFICRLLGCCL